MRDLITIIIPVYNLEHYIEECLDSVISQTYTNIEILLIDDSSTDNTLAICNKYALKDRRIRIIRKKHEGLSVIRNIGVKEAKGEYIAHIDGDDILASTYIEQLYGLIIEYNGDISICGFQSYSDGEKITEKSHRNTDVMVMNAEQALEVLLYQKFYTTSTWAKLFRKSLFAEVEFPYGSLAEDMATTYKLIHYAQKVVYSPSKQYFYRQRSSSIVHVFLQKREKDYIEQSNKMVMFIKENYPSLIQASYSRYFSSNIYVLSRIPFRNIYSFTHKEILKNIKKYRKSVLFDSKARLANRGCALAACFGIWFLKLGLLLSKQG